jgi:hypothetical protein
VLHQSDRRPRVKGARCRLSGRALVDFTGLYLARHGHWRVRLNLAADSVRLQRAGSAYIRDGTPIVVEGSECKLESDEARLSARRILPA